MKRDDKAHYVPWEQVKASVKKNGIPLTVELESACGLEAYLLSVHWEYVTCKRCLRKKPRKGRG